MRTMNITPEMKTIMTAAFMQLIESLTQPAETALAVASVATNAVAKVTGSRRISQTVRKFVQTQRVHNGGSVPTGTPVWQLIDDGIVDASGNYIADATAPTATAPTASTTAITYKQLMRLSKTELANLHLAA